jgi:organic hydroperoxide reductase OsmC/OhrA
MSRQHTYTLALKWTGNRGTGTDNYRAYDRSYTIQSEAKAEISGSSDAAFRGDKTKYNPEDLLVASLSSCHMLSYLHLCAEAGVTVIEYLDNATGIMEETESGGGHFIEVILSPLVTVADQGMVELANHLHDSAHKLCFIASSVNFEVSHRPVIQTAAQR